MRVLDVHTSISFQLGVTPFEPQLRALGKKKGWTAYHPALEFRDVKAKKATKHYLPACNFVPEGGGIPCHDFDACVEPAADEVFQAKPGDTSWAALPSLRPEGGCVARQPGITQVERTVGLNE